MDFELFKETAKTKKWTNKKPKNSCGQVKCSKIGALKYHKI